MFEELVDLRKKQSRISRRRNMKSVFFVECDDADE